MVLPIISFISSVVPWVLMAGILMMQIFPQLFTIGISLFSLSTIFCFLTLPVELDASKRALSWLKKTNVDIENEHAVAKRALNWAALSYVIVAIASLSILLFYILDLIAGHQAD
jgi:Zn-dependent membrane protease YugP